VAQMTSKKRIVSVPLGMPEDELWSRHDAWWREPSQIISQWQDAAAVDPHLLDYHVEGAWWEVLAECAITLLVTREYEHLVIAMGTTGAGSIVSYWCVPHPSGLAVDRERNIVYVASTRNPNQVYDLMPVTGFQPRLDMRMEDPLNERPLIPVRSRYYPGCLYLHDLALLDRALYGNAVGQNAVIRLKSDGGYQRVWWPRCIEEDAGPVFGRNHLQLNSMAAGKNLKTSYFSASTEKISPRRPGHRNFAVDRHGVIFSGKTREPIVWGLTRPHSARLFREKIWVDNSGYGEFGVVDHGSFLPVAQLPGWTRGLCFRQKVAFVGVSRVIPRFYRYAPGLDVRSSLCGVYAVHIESGQVLGSLTWPYGSQIFAVDWISNNAAGGFPFVVKDRRRSARIKKLFYLYSTENGNAE
jgi:uncharacterized protein (TIGR03032 family)